MIQNINGEPQVIRSGGMFATDSLNPLGSNAAYQGLNLEITEMESELESKLENPLNAEEN